MARQFLRRLTLVSQSDFEVNLQLALEGVLLRIGKENVAFVSVDEPPPTVYESGKERRVPGSSSDRIKHLLENLVRVHGNRVRANPTVASMRADRIRNIVLVEDFVGSGDRIRSYWRDRVAKSVKSWVSFGWTKVWIVCYASLKNSVAAVRRDVPVDPSRMVTILPPSDRRIVMSPAMNFVAEKYGRRLRGDAWSGYSQGGGAIVFQHGCPNNTPAMLWATGKGFKPLFPNRGIPATLQRCFGVANALSLAETLWDFGQYRLALSLLNRDGGRRDDLRMRMMVALGLASVHGRWDDKRVQKQLLLPAKDIKILRELAVQASLLSSPDGRITQFGAELIDRMKAASRTAPQRKAKAAGRLSLLSDLYYPDSCEGVAKF